MGGGCYRVAKTDLFFVGGYCENACFINHGGCEASSQFEAVKTEAHCELKPECKEKHAKPIEQVIEAIEEATGKGNNIFLYTSDMFNDLYYNKTFKKLPARKDGAYIAVNACVNTLHNFVDQNEDSWGEIYDKGIREIWLGVESADINLRNSYNKPSFTNDEVVRLTKEGREAGINVSWFLVDGVEDTVETQLSTFKLIKDADPYRIHIGDLQYYD